MKHLRLIAAVAVFAFASIASAQTAGTITLTATPSSGKGSVTPTLSWSTSPPATNSCTASGAWSGTAKAASGSQVQPAITSTSTYTITCAWPSTSGSADVSWIAPTTNSDGSPLTDLAGYVISWSTSSSVLGPQVTINDPKALTYHVTGLSPGTWNFAMWAVNSKGIESNVSNIAVTQIAGSPSLVASKSVTVTVDKIPSSPTGVTAIETTAYYVRPDVQRWVFLRGNRFDGKVKLGAACDELRATDDGYNVISRPSRAVEPKPPTGTVLVARCG